MNRTEQVDNFIKEAKPGDSRQFPVTEMSPSLVRNVLATWKKHNIDRAEKTFFTKLSGKGKSKVITIHCLEI